MAKGDFSGIKRKVNATEASLNSFINAAKVDGHLVGGVPVDKNARRGKFYRDPKTGQRIELDGKVQEIPLNAYEIQLLERAAEHSGLTLTSFIRSAAIRAALNKE
jgi:Protein of unknown function (DUF1778)